MKPLFPIFLLWIILIQDLGVQGQNGQMGDNYSGFSESGFNPALGVLSRNYLELNLVGANAALSNNYLYLHKGDYTIFNLIRKNPVFPKYGTDNLPFDYFDHNKLNNGYLSAKIAGTGVIYSLPGATIGFSVSSATSASFTRIPANVANIIYHSLNVPSQFNQYFENRNMNISALSGIEYQIHFSRVLKARRQNLLSAGANVSFTQAITGTYLHADVFNYTLINDTVMNISDFTGELGFAIPINYSDTGFSLQAPLFKGGGIDGDVGLVVSRLTEEPILHRYTKSCELPYREYLYRFGISINDFGKVKFRKNAQIHQFSQMNNIVWNSSDSIPYSTVDSLFQGISEYFMGSSNASLAGNSFEIWQPASVNILADFNLSRNILLNFRASIPIYLAPNQLHKPSAIALVTRYETEKFSISVPVSWYQYQKLNLGLAARFHFLTIGTDRIGAWLGTGNFTGIDFYFSLRFFFLKGSCSGVSRSKDCRDLRF